jgi:hypothetical protein
MSLIDKIFGTRRTLSDLSPAELRKEEILIARTRDKLFRKIDELAGTKKKLFEQGAKTSSPELRRALAQEFELKSAEQLMVARELNVRSKELMTVSRLRMVKEHRGRSGALGRLNLSAADVAKISGWIENDAVTQEMYLQQLDTLLDLGAQSDRDALAGAGLGESGSELMQIWEQMDRGELKQDEAFDAADSAVRRRASDRGAE